MRSTMLAAILANVFGVEAIRQYIVELDRTDRPFTTDAAVSEFLSACTQAQEVKSVRRSARTADVSAAELQEVGL